MYISDVMHGAGTTLPFRITLRNGHLLCIFLFAVLAVFAVLLLVRRVLGTLCGGREIIAVY